MASGVTMIAEIGSVHDGSLGNAMKLIEAAAACGADAVKFQTHIAEAETLRDAPAPQYFNAEPRFDYFRRTGFTMAQWKQLAAHCGNQNGYVSVFPVFAGGGRSARGGWGRRLQDSIGRGDQFAVVGTRRGDGQAGVFVVWNEQLAGT